MIQDDCCELLMCIQQVGVSGRPRKEASTYFEFGRMALVVRARHDSISERFVSCSTMYRRDQKSETTFDGHQSKRACPRVNIQYLII